MAKQTLKQSKNGKQRKSARKQSRAAKRDNSRLPQARPTTRISSSKWRQCAQEYFTALEDPFGLHAVCVPASINSPSQKVVFRGYTVMSTGTNGVGWVIACPGTGMLQNNCVYATGPTYTGTLGTVAYNADTGVLGSNTNSTNSASLNDDVAAYRIVASGLRIRNVTPLMARGCMVAGLEEPSHSSLISTSSNTDANVSYPGSWLQAETAERLNLDSGDWASVVWHPSNTNEYGYYTGSQLLTINTTVATAGNGTLGFYASTSNGVQTFEVEFVIIGEVVGRMAVGATPSESDPNGLAMVANIVSAIDVRKPRIGDRLPVLKKILHGAQTFIGFASDFAPIAKSIAAML